MIPDVLSIEYPPLSEYSYQSERVYHAVPYGPSIFRKWSKPAAGLGVYPNGPVEELMSHFWRTATYRRNIPLLTKELTFISYLGFFSEEPQLFNQFSKESTMHLSITLTVLLLTTLVASAPIRERNQTPAFDILPSSHPDVENRDAKPPARGPSTNGNVDVQTREVLPRVAADPDGAYGIPQALPGSKMTDPAGWSKREATEVQSLGIQPTKRNAVQSSSKLFTAWKRFIANCAQCHNFGSKLVKRPVVQNDTRLKKEGNSKREAKMGLTNSAGQGGANVAGNGGLAWG